MVTTVTSYTDSRNRAGVGEGYDGVVRVSVAGYYGTGALIEGGRAVVTAAHLFKGNEAATVHFETVSGSQSLAASQVFVHPNYDAVNGNHDLAIVWLNAPAPVAPVAADRYELYRNGDELGQIATLVGYGTPGSGASGTISNYSGNYLRLKANNRFDADIGTLKGSLGAVMGWSPVAGSQLVADFDDGIATHDALARLIGTADLGLGTSEGLIAPGDSGGPALLGNKLAGVASYSAALATSYARPDVDTVGNSSYGELAAWQRISYYQQWIDQTVRAADTAAPSKASQVQKTVAEGAAGTLARAYFLLEFTGTRSKSDQVLSVDYATRDGTAKAGSDYLAVSGTLKLYPGESQAVIPVEIIGDNQAEVDETFYLDISNPVGGSFGDGVVKLTAMRTIVNDDGSLIG